MFRFDGPNPLPSRTSNHEALITFHEMGHYITNRLVGNASGLMNQQGGAMGEGWGDFFAICMTSQATDDFANGVFAVGGWTDLTLELQGQLLLLDPPLSLLGGHDQEPADVQAHRRQRHAAGRPAAQSEPGGANNEVHNAGEIWCAALWEVFVNLVGGARPRGRPKSGCCNTLSAG